MKSKIYLLMTFSFFLVSCSDKMDRDKAKVLITQKYGLPFTVTDKLQYGEVNYLRNFSRPNVTAENALAEQKLIKFTNQGIKRDMFFSYDSYIIELTPEGQKYKLGETSDREGRKFYLVKVADQVFVDITGILEINNGKAAQVEYTWKYDNVTPFGTAFSLKNRQLNQSDQMMNNRPVYNNNGIFREKVMMVKYDDGWRIQGRE